MALIAIYDSGVGGLSIYQQVVARCPEHDYLFLCDNQAFPYGTKSEDELLSRVETVVERLDEHLSLEVLIVACNTASTIVLSHLRENFDFQVIGVVPAIKPAAEISVTKEIGLLATPATVERAYTNALISEFASDCQITRIGSTELVLLAEDKLYGREIDEAKLATILEPIIATQTIDVVVLACTHFPLLRDEMGRLFDKANRDILIIDSGKAIANRLSSIEKIHSLASSVQATRFAMMTDPDIESGFVTQLERMGFEQLQHLPV